MISDRSVFITGGLGFIGSRLVERLVERNRVTVFDSGRRNALRWSPAANHPNLEIVNGNVLDPDALEAALGDASIVLHMAAIAGVSSYYREPAATFRVNLLGTVNVIDLVKNRDLELFVDFSTSEIYGPRAERVSEKDGPAQGDLADRRWCYAVSKLAGEMLARCHYWEDGFPACAVRPFNIYGPGQVGEGIVSNFSEAVAREQPLKVTGDGSQSRALCHVDDFLDAVMTILERAEKIRGLAFNLGDPRHNVSVLEVAQRMAAMVEPPLSIEFVEHPGQDVLLRSPDCSMAREMLDYEPKRDLDAGLAETVEWFRAHRPWEAASR
jgi:nucleoside-diphosphate-sugar epimerase